MAKRFFRQYNSSIDRSSFDSRLLVALGQVSDLTGDIKWRDHRAAFFYIAPVLSRSERFAVAGEIRLTNRDELLEKIESRLGNRDSSDSEIVAALWDSKGEAAIALLEGMFSFAIYDRRTETLTLARDPSGARTIYYTVSGSVRWVSPGLRRIEPFISQEIDEVALRDYLSCAFVPGERTMWRDAREVRPGSIVRLPGEEKTVYREVREKIARSDAPIEWHAARLRSLLERVVAGSLPAGEPVGAYLSGGIDSSLVVALASRLHSQKVHTYSIHFGSQCPNELEFSGLVASHSRTDHHIIEITSDQMWNLLPETMSCLDDPIGDPLTVPNLILGRNASEFVSVILNGEGGDPCFGGPKNQPMLLGNLYRPAIESDAAPSGQVSAYLASFQKCSTDLDRLLRPDVWQRVKDAPSVFESSLAGEENFLNRLLFINIRFKGADHILTKVNNLTRAAGVTGHSPLFDQRVVEMSLEIPPEFKLSGAEEKAVLKKAVRDLLPESILLRPKSGMMVPVQYWFREKWNRKARSLLLSRRARIRGFLNQQVIADWLDYRGDTWSRYGVKLWLIVSLELWLQTHRSD